MEHLNYDISHRELMLSEAQKKRVSLQILFFLFDNEVYYSPCIQTFLAISCSSVST